MQFSPPGLPGHFPVIVIFAQRLRGLREFLAPLHGDSDGCLGAIGPLREGAVQAS